MKIKIVICLSFLMILIFAGSAIAAAPLPNTLWGSYAGANTAGNANDTFIGYSAGYTNVSGSHNTFLGTMAGYFNTAS